MWLAVPGARAGSRHRVPRSVLRSDRPSCRSHRASSCRTSLPRGCPCPCHSQASRLPPLRWYPMHSEPEPQPVRAAAPASFLTWPGACAEHPSEKKASVQTRFCKEEGDRSTALFDGSCGRSVLDRHPATSPERQAQSDQRNCGRHGHPEREAGEGRAPCPTDSIAPRTPPPAGSELTAEAVAPRTLPCVLPWAVGPVPTVPVAPAVPDVVETTSPVASIMVLRLIRRSFISVLCSFSNNIPNGRNAERTR